MDQCDGRGKPIMVVMWLVFINIWAIFLCCLDKHKAKKNKHRISEKTLWIVSFSGGASGMLLAMRLVHHKISKPSFYIPVWIALVCNMILVVLLFKINIG